MEDNLKNESLVLSALMHDIGKFAQRANEPKDKSLENTYCKPTDKGYYSHVHVLHSHAYLMDSKFPLPKELEAYRANIARYASAHHNPGVSPSFSDSDGLLFEEIIQRADCLSSGLDRIKGQEDEQNYKTAHLQSVFSHVSVQHDAEKKAYHSLKALSPNEKVFPTANKDAGKEDYANLFKEFVEDSKNIPTDEGYNAYFSSLLSQLEKYTYCVPSCTYGTEADISLYDHSLTTASIAQALYFGALEKNAKTQVELENINFRIFTAELSGIQKYIFTGNGGKGFTKILRARSFHLQVLTRSIILKICEKLNLMPIAKIMDVGGKFILILPDTKEVNTEIPKLMQEIEIYFAKHFQGELKLPMAFLPLSQKEMSQKDFIAKLDEINDSLEKNKLQLFGDYLKNNSSIYNVEYQDGVCAYCDRNAPKGEKDDEDNKICDECASLVKIGRALIHSDYALFTKTPPKNGTKLELIDGIYLVLDFQNDSKYTFALAEIQDSLDIINLRNRNKYTSYPIAGYIPQDDEGDYLSFEGLADKSIIEKNKEKRCVSMLGILKADVDNLGFTFSLGFDENLSISRFANLSRMLNFFFSEYLVAKIEKEKHNIYTVFAGGDDLFLLGSWTDIMHFAKTLHTDFAHFTAENKDMTLSAGIAHAKPKVPISTIAKMAEDALENSKHFTNSKEEVDKNNPTKNACTAFGITCSWNEYDKELDQGIWLEDIAMDEKISQGLIRRLLSYAKDCHDFQKGGDIKKGLYISHLQYDLARNAKDESVKSSILEMTSPDKFKNSCLAISYALYKTRKI